MPMLYQSTRQENNKVSASQAILQGLAQDGGLFTPLEMPKLNLDFDKLKKASYQEVAQFILKAFFDDFTEEEINVCVQSAYGSSFDDERIAPMTSFGQEHYLELYHGETIAFKDMALSILPYLMTTAAKKQGVDRKIVILTATSGDTGKAAMAGFEDVPNTEIIVFYPKNGVSNIQELQMTTQTGTNTHVIAIEGNFDDAQTEVKRLFNDNTLKSTLLANNIQFSSANSMNIGRLVPQIVYYVYAYAQLIKSNAITKGQEINIVVPTGNFGNILAAYYAKEIGLPVAKLICASNENNVLTDFFKSHTYNKKRDFKLTSSPSMDILVSSNLERLVFHLMGNDAKATKKLMDQLTKDNQYQIQALKKEIFDFFDAGFATEEATKEEIKRVFKKYGYTIDPHTAVASAVYQDYLKKTKDKTPTLIVSTASPYKFPSVVVTAIENERPNDDFEAVDLLNKISQVSVPKAVDSIEKREIKHHTTCAISEMQKAVETILLGESN